MTKVKRPIQYVLQKLRLFALDRFQNVHVDSDSYSSMCTLSRKIYSEAVEITIKIETSAIGKMT